MGLVTVLVGGVGWSGTASAEAATLKDLAKGWGITFGTAVSALALAGGEDYRERLGTEFGAVTTEDALKRAVVEPAKGDFSGTIDDVRLYASVLSAADVVKLAAGTVVR